MGGSFGAGFLSGSLGSYLGSSGHSKNMPEMISNTARDAVVGGTISKRIIHYITVSIVTLCVVRVSDVWVST
jgi:hypothetical protein